MSSSMLTVYFQVFLLAFGFILILFTSSAEREVSDDVLRYSPWDDVSWAIIYPNVSDRLRQRPKYEQFVKDCERIASTEYCQFHEQWRMQMNMYQPRSVYNYTKTGFYKTRAPKHIRKLIDEFWDKNRHQGVIEWTEVTTFHNHWEVPTYMVHLDNRSLPGGSPTLQTAISSAVSDLMEEWTGMRQAVSSIYGIRMYLNQSILAPHVDRLPLVSSCIINVDQDVDEDWPLEVYGHNGLAYNVTMRPGDMLFYESHSVIHGRPFPLKGKFYANIFIHFEPFAKLNETSNVIPKRNGRPPYLVPGSSWEPEWWEMNTRGWDLLQNPWRMAERGDLYTLTFLVKHDSSQIHRVDKKGWQPLFYACKQGHIDVVMFLVEQGARVNALSAVRPFLSPLSIANSNLGVDSNVSRYLRAQGALIQGFEAGHNKFNSLKLKRGLEL